MIKMLHELWCTLSPPPKRSPFYDRLFQLENKIYTLNNLHNKVNYLEAQIDMLINILLVLDHKEVMHAINTLIYEKRGDVSGNKLPMEVLVALKKDLTE